MPTILKSISIDLDKAAEDLERARGGELLGQPDIDNLVTVINGSAVGASKVLHFAAPANYAIWDSRVATYLGAKVQYRPFAVAQYVAYNERCRTTALMPEAQAIKNRVGQIIRSDVTAMRALELVMYCSALEGRTYAWAPSRA